VVRVEPLVPEDHLWQMPVWMRVASPNLMAALSVQALLTPTRVLPAKFSFPTRLTAGATRNAGKKAPVLVVSSVRQSMLTMEA
jgi:hypothetical protein